jgi:hypothetical protein
MWCSAIAKRDLNSVLQRAGHGFGIGVQTTWPLSAAINPAQQLHFATGRWTSSNGNSGL